MEQEMPMGDEMPMEEEQPVRGRGAAMQRWKESNADAENDPEDDDLYDFSLGQADEWKGKFDKQNEVKLRTCRAHITRPKVRGFDIGRNGG